MTRSLLKRRYRQNGHPRTPLRAPKGGGSPQSEADDGLRVNGVGDLTGGRDHGVRGGLFEAEGGGIYVVSVVSVGLYAIYDALLHGYGFFGVLSCRALGAEHDGVRPVVNCRGHVGGLRPGGSGVVDHALEHLRGDDDRLAHLSASVDDSFLQKGDVLGGTLHAEITSRDHDSIAQLDNFFQRIPQETRWFFYFCHDCWNMSTRRKLFCNKLDHFFNIFRSLDKRQSDPIHANLQHIF
mmetsp:Transcript_5057/g.10206  ORF Transcript_5057/g.10206 Transcript_5057/m.10206 type:complete len:238 (-) Transcript_5057:974-1687(-)